MWKLVNSFQVVVSFVPIGWFIFYCHNGRLRSIELVPLIDSISRICLSWWTLPFFANMPSYIDLNNNIIMIDNSTTLPLPLSSWHFSVQVHLYVITITMRWGNASNSKYVTTLLPFVAFLVPRMVPQTHQVPPQEEITSYTKTNRTNERTENNNNI